MDKTLHTESFERLLKEKSDEFRMYPTRKVWRSIYNNIYPGRRWPSGIIGITLMAMLPLIGFLDTKTPSPIIKNAIVKNIAAAKPPSLFSSKIIEPFIKTSYTDSRKYIATKTSVTINNKKNHHQNIPSQPRSVYLMGIPATTLPDKKDIILADLNNNENNLAANFSETNTETDIKNSVFEKNLIAENYALQNDQPAQKWSDKLALQVYASPSVIYGIASNIPVNLSSFSADDANNLNSSVGLEAGTAMQYSLSDIIKVKAGLQFNYASYDVAATYQNASATAPLFPNDAASTSSYDMLSRSSDYNAINSNSPLTLHNEMYQFSLPVGMELKLLKHKKLQWNAGATIQPTYIAGGNAYLLSPDNHTYIDESSLINKWNLNAGFETFITYKIDGVIWQVGPQFRYQFSSTYNKAYSPIDEKVAVFGVKIGVIKVLH